jgi:hypothetical protein
MNTCGHTHSLFSADKLGSIWEAAIVEPRWEQSEKITKSAKYSCPWEECNFF